MLLHATVWLHIHSVPPQRPSAPAGDPWRSVDLFLRRGSHTSTKFSKHTSCRRFPADTDNLLFTLQLNHIPRGMRRFKALKWNPDFKSIIVEIRGRDIWTHGIEGRTWAPQVVNATTLGFLRTTQDTLEDHTQVYLSQSSFSYVLTLIKNKGRPSWVFVMPPPGGLKAAKYFQCARPL